MAEISRTKERNSNLELYRIIVMLLIVAHHYVVNSGLFSVMEENPLSAKSLFLYLFGMWGKTGINCFVLITGYFMCKSEITIRKFCKLLLEVEFYKILFFLIFAATGYADVSMKGIFYTLMPITSNSHDFVSCFLLFYLFIPFLNVTVRNINQTMHKRLLFLCIFAYSVLDLLSSEAVSFNYVSWFIVLYFISSYIRLYGLFPHVTNLKWGGIALVMACVSMASVIAILLYNTKTSGIFYMPYRMVSDSNVLLGLMTSVSCFMFFKGLKIKQNKAINTIAASTFGVLLIHANSDAMRQWLWKDTLDNVGAYSSNIYLHAVLSVLLVFAICIVIDYIRIHTIERWIFTNIFDRIKCLQHN